MEALNKESKFAAPVLTWAQKRSDLREKSTLGKFVNSLQGLNHEDVLLKLETKIINNGKGHARASAHGLRAIMETMLHGSQFYMLFKEAFHIYGSFFDFYIRTDNTALQLQLAPANDTVGFAIIKYQIGCKGI